MSRHSQLSSLFLIFVLAILSIGPSLTSAQNGTADNMQALLERLVEKVDNNPGLIVYITFVHPLVGNETEWGIGDPADDLNRRIVEVGEDYVCFREILGAADERRCTPFSNIVGITYLNN
jgi:hypothetical protein